MPSRFFTSGRKFSTTTSAFLTSRRNTASPSGAFRFSVMLRLLRCRFWKSEPSRGPPGGSPLSSCGGDSILVALAPQSASWRTQVGPERTRVRSRTVKRERAFEALGIGISDVSHAAFSGQRLPPGRFPVGYRVALKKTSGARDIPRYRHAWPARRGPQKGFRSDAEIVMMIALATATVLRPIDETTMTKELASTGNLRAGLVHAP